MKKKTVQIVSLQIRRIMNKNKSTFYFTAFFVLYLYSSEA